MQVVFEEGEREEVFRTPGERRMAGWAGERRAVAERRLWEVVRGGLVRAVGELEGLS